MTVLVDTSVWSVAFRRRQGRHPVDPVVAALTELVREGRAGIVGPVRQELLTGIKHSEQFDRLRERLLAFPDIALERDDFEEAARSANRCRAGGIQGSSIDFLLCAVAIRRKLAIFTTDEDFVRFQPVLGLTLHGMSGG